MNVKKTTRREGALKRLEAQLKTGKKPLKMDDVDTGKKIELTEKDSNRIKAEITTLKAKV
jgi:hypothetical protein